MEQLSSGSLSTVATLEHIPLASGTRILSESLLGGMALNTLWSGPTVSPWPARAPPSLATREKETPIFLLAAFLLTPRYTQDHRCYGRGHCHFWWAISSLILDDVEGLLTASVMLRRRAGNPRPRQHHHRKHSAALGRNKRRRLRAILVSLSISIHYVVLRPMSNLSPLFPSHPVVNSLGPSCRATR